MGVGSWESGVGSRESEVGSRRSGVGDRESGVEDVDAPIIALAMAEALVNAEVRINVQDIKGNKMRQNVKSCYALFLLLATPPLLTFSFPPLTYL